jgi:hypothetical protein
VAFIISIRKILLGLLTAFLPLCVWAESPWNHHWDRVGDESLLYLLHMSRQSLPPTSFDSEQCHPPADKTPADPSTFSEWIPSSGWRTVQELSLKSDEEKTPVARLQYFERLHSDGQIPLKAYLVTIFNARNEFSFPSLIPNKSRGVDTLSRIVENQGVLAAINGGYFNSSSLSFAADKGQVLSLPISTISRSYRDERGRSVNTHYNAIRAAFAATGDGKFKMKWMCPLQSRDESSPNIVALSTPLPHAPDQPPIPLDEFLAGSEPWEFESGIGGGPMLIYEGRERITLEEELFWGSGDITPQKRQPRTAIGYKGSTLYMLVIDGRAEGVSCGLTLKELALTFEDLGVEYAMNLDGGASTMLWLSKEWLVDQERMPTPGFVLNRPSKNGTEREIGSALGIRRRQ